MEYIATGIEFFQKGGAVMYVLLLCSLFVVAIGVERALYFHRNDSGRGFARDFYQFVIREKYEEAVKLAAENGGVVSAIICEAIQKDSAARAAHYMELQSGIALSKLRQRLYYLSVIVTMAPLFGLLGTISGMISSFRVFHADSGQAAAITGGVGEALIATAMGLCVAIVALSVHAYFSQRLEGIVTDMEECFSLVEEHREDLAGKSGLVQYSLPEMEGGMV